MTTRRWFHQNLSGVAAEKLLNEKGRDGSFLCRPSRSNKNDYTLCVRREGSVTHIKIQNHGNYFDLSGGEPFPTLPDLIKYYQEHGLQDKTGELIQLLYPVNCKDPTSGRWFHGPMNGSDAERLLLEKGKNGSYLVRESTNNLGHYVITIRSDDQFKHVKMRNIDGKYDVGGEPSFPSISKLIDFYGQHPMVEESGGTVLHLKQPFNSTKFTAISIGERVKELEKELKVMSGKEGFWEEWELLQQQETKHRYTRRVGLSAENKIKNRYKNIVPFDHTRVILKDTDNDYINASYIGEDNKHDYIASQGCLPETISDFWLMVYQQNSIIILMLTQEVEKKGKPRCAKYWPDLDQSMPIGNLTICNRKETQTQEFTLRELELKNTSEPSQEAYTIYQYQFVAWPETSHPANVGSVLGILHDISLKQKDCPTAGPPIVHCSDGIGRTAALIVIDMLVKTLQKKGLECEIDVQKVVQHVRTQRPYMIQLEAQYKFIYLAIRHHVEMELIIQGQVETKRPVPSPTKGKKFEVPPERPLRRTSSRDREPVHVSNTPPPPPVSHRPPTIPPPMIAINGTLPPPIPQRKSGNDPSMCNIFSKPQHVEDPPLPSTPPPIPERKKGN